MICIGCALSLSTIELSSASAGPAQTKVLPNQARMGGRLRDFLTISNNP